MGRGRGEEVEDSRRDQAVDGAGDNGGGSWFRVLPSEVSLVPLVKIAVIEGTGRIAHQKGHMMSTR